MGHCDVGFREPLQASTGRPRVCAVGVALGVAVGACGYPALTAEVPIDGPSVPCGEIVPMPPGGSYIELTPPSCAGLAAICGPNADRNCCEAAAVPGGHMYRDCDRATDDMLFKDNSHPAMVSAFVLDRYEVTVGRFRRFVNAGKGTQQGRPAAGSGAHPRWPGSGWDSTWDDQLVDTTATLTAAVQCDPKHTIWTDNAGANEDKAMNCVTWYEAMAFCIWDGGYLPTEAEWEFAAMGGSEQRAYPWSVPESDTTIDCSRANYQVSESPVLYCSNGMIGNPARVGAESPAGDGKWGHSDLAGNVFEWVLDWYGAYPLPCIDCVAPATGTSNARVLRGGGFFNEMVSILRTNYRQPRGPLNRVASYGFRCARAQ